MDIDAIIGWWIDTTPVVHAVVVHSRRWSALRNREILHVRDGDEERLYSALAAAEEPIRMERSLYTTLTGFAFLAVLAG